MPPSSYRSVPRARDVEPEPDGAVHPGWRAWLEEIHGAGIARELTPAVLPDPARALLSAAPEPALRGVVLSAYYLGRDPRCRARARADGYVDLGCDDGHVVEQIVPRFAEALELALSARASEQGWELALGPHLARIRRVITHARVAVRRSAAAATVGAPAIVAAINLLLATAGDPRRVVPLRSAPGRAAFMPLRWSQATRLAIADQLACAKRAEWADLYDRAARAAEHEPQEIAARESDAPEPPRPASPPEEQVPAVVRLAAITVTARPRGDGSPRPAPITVVEATLVRAAEHEVVVATAPASEPPPPLGTTGPTALAIDARPRPLDDAIARIAAIAARTPPRAAAVATGSSIDDALARLVVHAAPAPPPLPTRAERSNALDEAIARIAAIAARGPARAAITPVPIEAPVRERAITVHEIAVHEEPSSSRLRVPRPSEVMPVGRAAAPSRPPGWTTARGRR